MSIGNFLKNLSQAVSVGIMLVGGLGVWPVPSELAIFFSKSGSAGRSCRERG